MFFNNLLIKSNPFAKLQRGLLCYNTTCSFGAPGGSRTHNDTVGGCGFIQLDYGYKQTSPFARACDYALVNNNLKLVVVNRVHVADKIYYFVAVAHFVVIPRNEFYKAWAELDTSFCVENACASFADEVA